MVPGMPVWIMAFGVGLMTPVPYPIAYALIGGLSADSVVKHPEALGVFPEVQLMDFDSAAKDALERTHPSHIERVWDDGRRAFRFIKHEGCFVDHRQIQVNAETETLVEMLKQFLGKRENFVKVTQTDHRVVVCAKRQVAGEKWVEWRVDRADKVTHLKQTVFFCPHGLPGFLYWYLLYPFHLIKHRSLIRAITQQSRTQ